MHETAAVSTAPAPASEQAVPGEPDAALVARLQAGDSTAFAPLMRRYNQRLFRIARSVLRDDDDAEDAVQDGYLRAFTRIDRYVPDGSFPAWLSRIVLNEALSRRRAPARLRRDPLDEEPVQDPAAAGAGDPMTATERARFRGLVEEAIDALPDEFRTVFVLRAVQQLSVAETAHCLDIPQATVKTRFLRARQRVRTHLARRVDALASDAFAFAGTRCDRIVSRVLARLAPDSAQRH